MRIALQIMGRGASSRLGGIGREPFFRRVASLFLDGVPESLIPLPL